MIDASGVTVDLMGFSLTGDGGYGDTGIHVDGETNAVIDNVVIKGGTVSGFFHGLRCDYMNNSRIEQMVVFRNTQEGVYLYAYQGQCNGNAITDCSISGNATYSVFLYATASGECNGNTIAGCAINGNGLHGVYLYGYEGQCEGNTIRENTISKNTSRGIYLVEADGNRIEANNVWGTIGASSYGIKTINTEKNVILKNTCIGQVNNFSLDPDDTYGPIVTSTGALATSGDGAHPWANFSR